jgi:hypothetical protein
MHSCFTMKHQGHKHRLAMTSLYPAPGSAEHDRRAYFLSCGVYTSTPRDPDRLKWTGMSLSGTIPVAELVRWATRKGYLQWECTPWFRRPEGGAT